MAWFYDTSVSYQDLQAQNFRLVEMLLNYNLAGQQVYYLQVTQYIEPILPQTAHTNKRVKKKPRKETKKVDDNVIHKPVYTIPTVQQNNQVDVEPECDRSIVTETPQKHPRKEIQNWIHPMKYAKVVPSQE